MSLFDTYHVKSVGTVNLGWRELVLEERPWLLWALLFRALPRDRRFLLKPHTATEWFEKCDDVLKLCSTDMRLLLCDLLEEHDANRAFGLVGDWIVYGNNSGDVPRPLSDVSPPSSSGPTGSTATVPMSERWCPLCRSTPCRMTLASGRTA